MKLQNVKDPEKLFEVIDSCSGKVELVTGEGDRLNLKSKLSQYLSLANIFSVKEEIPELELVAYDPNDVKKLIDVLQKLVDAGNTVLVIEHNLDVIKTADYIIDLGPEGGSGGGTIVATGRPEDIVKVPASYTGKFLKPLLEEAAQQEGNKDHDGSLTKE